MMVAAPLWLGLTSRRAADSISPRAWAHADDLSAQAFFWIALPGPLVLSSDNLHAKISEEQGRPVEVPSCGEEDEAEKEHARSRSD